MLKVTARQRFTMLTGHHNVLRCPAKTQRKSSLTYSHILFHFRKKIHMRMAIHFFGIFLDFLRYLSIGWESVPCLRHWNREKASLRAGHNQIECRESLIGGGLSKIYKMQEVALYNA